MVCSLRGCFRPVYLSFFIGSVLLVYSILLMAWWSIDPAFLPSDY